mmetsp:Transcript_8093/g.25872  ORF Transcript_8093/g.25872 Transcript_8093/m.25872 type:complete len:584 (-) Transcript_8093:447-2198(-)
MEISAESFKERWSQLKQDCRGEHGPITALLEACEICKVGLRVRERGVGSGVEFGFLLQRALDILVDLRQSSSTSPGDSSSVETSWRAAAGLMSCVVNASLAGEAERDAVGSRENLQRLRAIVALVYDHAAVRDPSLDCPFGWPSSLPLWVVFRLLTFATVGSPDRAKLAVSLSLLDTLTNATLAMHDVMVAAGTSAPDTTMSLCTHLTECFAAMRHAGAPWYPSGSERARETEEGGEGEPAGERDVLRRLGPVVRSLLDASSTLSHSLPADSFASLSLSLTTVLATCTPRILGALWRWTGDDDGGDVTDRERTLGAGCVRVLEHQARLAAVERAKVDGGDEPGVIFACLMAMHALALRGPASLVASLSMCLFPSLPVPPATFPSPMPLQPHAPVSPTLANLIPTLSHPSAPLPFYMGALCLTLSLFDPMFLSLRIGFGNSAGFLASMGFVDGGGASASASASAGSYNDDAASEDRVVEVDEQGRRWVEVDEAQEQAAKAAGEAARKQEKSAEDVRLLARLNEITSHLDKLKLEEEEREQAGESGRLSDVAREMERDRLLAAQAEVLTSLQQRGVIRLVRGGKT